MPPASNGVGAQESHEAEANDGEDAGLMRCDLHVHSRYSGPAEVPVLEHVGKECYSDPLAVYEQAIRRGMDLVTLTDHDSIEGALALACLPGTFVGEEITVELEGGRKLHVNAWGLTEANHAQIQSRRRDPEALFAYLAEQRIPAAVNHLFSALTGARELPDLRLPVGRLRLVEALNGAMPEGHNEYARLLGRSAGMAPVGGSDSHCLAHVARAWTTVAGARTKEEFLDGLRRGLSVPCGRSGSYARLTSEVARIFAAAYEDTSRELARGVAPLGRLLASAALLPLLPLIPLFTLGVYAHEVRFGTRHFQSFREAFGWPALPAEGRPALGASTLEEAA
jgi:predicted metal-dependent phosphoesterase TrpH